MAFSTLLFGIIIYLRRNIYHSYHIQLNCWCQFAKEPLILLQFSISLSSFESSRHLSWFSWPWSKENRWCPVSPLGVLSNCVCRTTRREKFCSQTHLWISKDEVTSFCTAIKERLSPLRVQFGWRLDTMGSSHWAVCFHGDTHTGESRPGQVGTRSSMGDARSQQMEKNKKY